MAEFCIKRKDAVHANPDIDKRNCFKRGDIVEVRPDGAYDDKPWQTVLKVSGLNWEKALRLMEPHHELETEEREVLEEEFQKVKNDSEQVVFNDKTYTVYMGKYIDPTLLSNKNGVRTYEVKKLRQVKIRRFRIPSSIMDGLFPDGVYHVSISKQKFLNDVKHIFDFAHNKTIDQSDYKNKFYLDMG